MIVADVPTRGERRGAQLRENPGQVGEWPDYFDDVVDVICPPAYRRDPRDGYATGLSAAPGPRDGAPGGTLPGTVSRAGIPRISCRWKPVPTRRDARDARSDRSARGAVPGTTRARRR